MPKLNIHRPHSLSPEEVEGHIHSLVEQVRAQFPSLVSDIRWSTDGRQAHVKGKMFTGNFSVTDRDVSAQIDLSFLARPFLPRIQQEIENALDRQFGAR